ncbi:MAG: nuclear transport factor 2 family protein [Chloroflexi bacterium]|nr:nuclear transport factor 2 family protein [Chloroflexota bacterium]
MKLTAEDRLETQELLHRYMFILDVGEHHGNGLQYADLYTEDGTFGTRPPGREALAAAAGRAADGTYSEVHQRGAQNQIHMSVGEIIVPTADGAKGISYLLMIEGPANQIYWAGWYEDVYAKTSKAWRFKSRAHVAGSRAGIPSSAAAIRREWQKLAMQHLTCDEAVAISTQPMARDPLNWVDSLE